MADRPRRAFVCGHPVAHSRSPLIHGFWLRQFGIAGSYEKVDVAPAKFAAFVDGLSRGDGFVGGNVTIPHKERAFALVKRRDAAAEAIGAVNTLWVEEGLVHGGNTDAYGFSASLDERAPRWREGRTAAVLGAGGAARAIIHALKTAGYSDIRIVNRTPDRANELAARFGASLSAHSWNCLRDCLDAADLMVNTTSVGMAGKGELDWDLAALPQRAVVADAVYTPLETPLLAAARGRGLTAVDGLGMLLNQAAPGFERWFGRRPRVTAELRNLVVADLERSAA